ncbi:MAG: hypothetical protein BGO26_10170 [Actinobacteria bacterium 69-20]|nr:hypothetical protein [Actinomycetota bacterium]OJV23264.1 MAG: hypothetical protein BGO26_10170 [Actinobacteria bacterium 69-20]
MTDPIPDEAVEAAYRGYCDARLGHRMSDANFEAAKSRVEVAWMRAALTAAAPLIAAQATADLRAGIEALLGEWRSTPMSPSDARTVAICADALDALLREGES